MNEHDNVVDSLLDLVHFFGHHRIPGSTRLPNRGSPGKGLYLGGARSNL
jgi:hypothetical protein